MAFAFLAQPVLVVAAALLVDFSAAAALSSLAAVSAVAFLVGLTAVAAFASVAFFFASFASVRAFFFASFASVRRCLFEVLLLFFLFPSFCLLPCWFTLPRAIHDFVYGGIPHPRDTLPWRSHRRNCR